MQKDIDRLMIDTIRTLSADAIQKAKSGHPGTPVGAAPIGYTVFNKMRIDPTHPEWANRDRFVLSAGHASMLLYSLLHINGYDVSVEDIKNFRQLGSKTPGHPEIEVTPGVDASTGPLGQGFAMAVGMAMAQARLAAEFNRDGFPVCDNYTYVLMGDGCVMEGISSEAASLAGTLKLSRLIAIYDSNNITIEGNTDIAFTEDVGKRFEAHGFNVLYVKNGEDIKSIAAAIDSAKAQSEKPTLIIVSTHIAHGTLKADMASAHGEPLGDECIQKMKEDMGWTFPPFSVPAEVYAHADDMQKLRTADYNSYSVMFAEYRRVYPTLAAKWDKWHSAASNETVEALSEMFGDVPDGKAATRQTSSTVINKLFSTYGFENLFGGSADLGPSNKTYLEPKQFFAAGDYAHANIHFGIRELAMAAICNGVALYGGLIPYCATFMVFSDYVKPALRLSALMGLRVLYVFTHDSIGVGEDGPTHQPVEQLTALRATPNVSVFRPADYKETVAAYISALSKNHPTALIMSRQNLPQYANTGKDALRGGYIVKDCKTTPDCILLASGSELELALSAAEKLEVEGVLNIRVVSMPCMELFDAQPKEYKQSVLPANVRARVAVEAGSSMSWYKYIGIDGATVTMDSFGVSAPAARVFEHFGFTVDNVVDAVKRCVK